VIVEEPLQISLIYRDRLGDGQYRIYLVTMRTPGDDLTLVTGLLLANGIIKSACDIIGINDQLEANEIFRNKIKVRLSADVVVDWALINRYTTSFSSCGVCDKSSIQSLELSDIPSLDTGEHWLPGILFLISAINCVNVKRCLCKPVGCTAAPYSMLKALYY
jgi:FdhD protein